LSDFLEKGPDAICIAALPEEGALIMKQAREMGYTGMFIGGNMLNTDAVIQLAGTAAEGMLVGTAWDRYSNAPGNQTFINAYRTRFGTEPGQYAAQAYTAVWLVARAMKNANSAEPQAVRDALAALQNIDTPLGIFSFNEDREPVRPAAVQMVQNGVFVIVN
jgi:branched-chain amino acid transport system substrate-binding protein